MLKVIPHLLFVFFFKCPTACTFSVEHYTKKKQGKYNQSCAVNQKHGGWECVRVRRRCILDDPIRWQKRLLFMQTYRFKNTYSCLSLRSPTIEVIISPSKVSIYVLQIRLSLGTGKIHPHQKRRASDTPFLLSSCHFVACSCMFCLLISLTSVLC
jgi:hypothetical protein